MINFNLFARVVLYNDGDEIARFQNKLNELKRFSKLHRIYWYNGKQSGLGILDEDLFIQESSSVDDNRSKNDIKLGIIYKRDDCENDYTVIALCRATIYNTHDEYINASDSILPKKKESIYNQFSILPIGTKILLDDCGYNRFLNIFTNPFIISKNPFYIKNINSFELQNAKIQIIKHLIKLPMFYAIKHNILFKQNDLLIKKITGEIDYYSLFQSILKKGLIFIFFILLFLSFPFVGSNNRPENIIILLKEWIYSNKTFFSFTTCSLYIAYLFFEITLKILLVSKNNLIKFINFLFQQEFAASLLVSIFFLLVGYVYFKQVKTHNKVPMTKVFTDFLIDLEINTCIFFPFQYLVLFRTDSGNAVVSINNISQMINNRLSQHLDSLVGGDIKRLIYASYIQDYFSQNLSIKSFTNKIKQTEEVQQ